LSLDSYNIKIVNYVASGETEVHIYQRGIVRNKEKKNKTYTESEIERTYLDQIMDKQRSINNSLKRTKSIIYDYARANTWDYFITLTLNKEKVDRYNYDILTDKIKNWLDGFRRRNPDLKYIIVPEQHEDGAWHFHGLISNADNENFIDSGQKTPNGEIVYNFGSYNLGFTTATKIKDSAKVANYITKYITKVLMLKIENRKRYWNSRNLTKGEIEEINYTDSNQLEEFYKNIKKICTREKVQEIKQKGYSNKIIYLTIKHKDIK